MGSVPDRWLRRSNFCSCSTSIETVNDINHPSSPLAFLCNHPSNHHSIFSTIQSYIWSKTSLSNCSTTHSIHLSGDSSNKHGWFQPCTALESPRAQPHQPQGSLCASVQCYQYSWTRVLLLVVWIYDRLLVMVNSPVKFAFR